MGMVALITVIYELLEWLAAVALGGEADAFLGTQGYIWDTQTDLFLAHPGSISFEGSKVERSGL